MFHARGDDEIHIKIISPVPLNCSGIFPKGEEIIRTDLQRDFVLIKEQ